MRERGVEVLLLHELLAQTLDDKEAREWLLSRRIRPEEVTVMFTEPLTAWLTEMPSDELATRLTGGVTVLELPDEIKSAIGDALHATDFVLPPLPNQLFTRDTSAWLYGGVSLNPMFWPARQLETLNVEAIYRFHPRFRDADFKIWFGGADHDWGSARIEGGDMMPVGTASCSSAWASAAPPGRSASSPRTCSPRCRAARDRGPDAARASGDAPRHGVHLLRPRPRDALRAGRLPDPADPVHSRRAGRGAGRGLGAVVPRRGAGRPRTNRAEARRDRQATSSRPSGTSGTTATTWSRWSRGS